MVGVALSGCRVRLREAGVSPLLVAMVVGSVRGVDAEDAVSGVVVVVALVVIDAAEEGSSLTIKPCCLTGMTVPGSRTVAAAIILQVLVGEGACVLPDN